MDAIFGDYSGVVGSDPARRTELMLRLFIVQVKSVAESCATTVDEPVATE